MAQSGTTFTLQSNSYQGRYMKLTCTSTQDIANNKTNISWTLESIGGSSSYYATICKVNINGTEVYSIDKGYSYKQFPVAKGSTTGSLSVAMNNDGSHGAITIYMDVAIYTSSTTRYSDTWQLNTIPRYPTINSFTVDKISGSSTQLKFNWTADSTIDYLWYSTNNGSSWTGYDTADATSGNFTVGGLASNTGYNCKIRLRRKDSQLTKDSGTYWQSTYQQPSANISTANITGYNGLSQIKVNWSSNMDIAKVEYSRDNGGSWYNAGDPNASSGSYTYTGLTEGQSYNFKVRLTATTGSCVTTSATSARATYKRVSGNLYVNGTKVATNNGQTGVALKNGDTLEIKDISNGANCSYQLFFENPDNQNFWASSTVSGTTTLSMNADQIAARLQYMPNNPSQGFNVGIVTLNGSTRALYYEFYGTLTAVNVNPTFDANRWTYQDTNASTVALTGDNQILVNGFSKLRVSVNTAASGNGYATISQYTVSGCTSGSSTTTGNIDCATPTNGGTITVTARDSRSNTTPTTKTATFKDYFVPTLTSISATRNNGGVGTVTRLTFNGTWWNKNFGASANTLTAVYRYRSNSTWSEARAITLTIDQQDPNKYSFNDNIYGDLSASGFTLGTTFTIEVTITDELNGGKSWTTTLNSGTPAIAISGNKVAIGKQYDTNKGGDLQVLGSVFLGNNDGTGNFQIHGQNGSNIYWKEYGYGDQFRIIPEFGGVDDSNKLRIQGAVGAAGTAPSLYDLMTISGKNGNLDLKGSAIIRGTLNGAGSTKILGAAGDKPLMVRGIAGCASDGSALDDLHLNYGTDYAVKFGKTAQTLIDANGTIKIPKDGGAGRGITNSSGVSIIRDHNNSNVTVDATGAVLYLGYQNTTGLNILNGKDTIDSNGTITFTRGQGINLGSGTIKGSASYGDIIINNTGGYTYLAVNGTNILSVRSNGLYGKNGYPYYTGKDLYNNSSGTNGNITLSETAANFTFIDVFYIDSHSRVLTARTYSPSTGGILLYTNSPFAKSQTCMADVGARKFNGTAFNLADDEYGTWNSWNNSWSRNNNIKVIRVVGWRTT